MAPLIEKRPNRDIPVINDRIRFPTVRVIGSDGSQLGIMSSREAMQLADEKQLDLVLVSDKADPPVCKIVDYGKHKFEQEKKAKEAKKKQHNVDVKEVRCATKLRSTTTMCGSIKQSVS